MNEQTLKRPFSSLRNERGFTLVELLTVVAIIAIIGGGMIAAYDGLEGRAATGAATGTLASLEAAVRTFQVIDEALPNDLESLIAADTPTSFSLKVGQTDCSDLVDAALDHAAQLAMDPGANTFVKMQMLTSSLSGKIELGDVTDNIVKSLVLGGITKVRFLDKAAEAFGTTTIDTKIPAADCTDAKISADGVASIDISMHAFEAPRPGGGATGRNRGRGWNAILTKANGDARDDLGTTAGKFQLAFWETTPGLTCGYNCVKVGGKSTSTLVVMGLGNSSTLVGSDSPVSLGHAPYYSKILKHEYPHYSLLISVDNTNGTKPARLIAIIDSRGDFLEEEYAETTGQKS